MICTQVCLPIVHFADELPSSSTATDEKCRLSRSDERHNGRQWMSYEKRLAAYHV